MFFLNDTFSPGLLRTVNATGNFVSAKNDTENDNSSSSYFVLQFVVMGLWLFLIKLSFNLISHCVSFAG